jgi:hypothetical protein
MLLVVLLVVLLIVVDIFFVFNRVIFVSIGNLESIILIISLFVIVLLIFFIKNILSSIVISLFKISNNALLILFSPLIILHDVFSICSCKFLLYLNDLLHILHLNLVTTSHLNFLFSCLFSA